MHGDIVVRFEGMWQLLRDLSLSKQITMSITGGKMFTGVQ